MKIDLSKGLRLQAQLSGLGVESIAREVGWTERGGSKIAASSFCSAMMEAAKSPSASLRSVAFAHGALFAQSVSKQAIHKRVDSNASLLLESTLGQAVGAKRPANAASSICRLGFHRVVVQDSTSIALPRHLAEVFAGPSNASGKGAAMKVHASFDLVSSRFVSFETRPQRSPDQSFSLEGVDGLGKGDLLLRDLGYFSVAAFRLLRENGAHAAGRAARSAPDS